MAFYLPLALILIGSVPAGFAAALVSGNLAGTPRPSWTAMIATCGLIGGWAFFVMPSIVLLAISFALGWTLLVLATVDALAFRLPDILTLPMIAVGLAVSWWLPDRDIIGHTIAAAAGMAVFYAIAVAYRRTRGQDGLGLGDVKLAGVAGAWLGWQALPYVVLLGCAVGLVWVGIATMRRGRAALSERIPFGVALCFAIWIVWLYGPPDVFGPLS
jgi:leader peptidase (prepilin peptidase)/N-methyltransferase